MITDRYLAKLCKTAQNTKTQSINNVQLLKVNYNNRATILAFRGSELKLTPEGIRDIITNLTAFPKVTKECGKVHRGIYKAAKRVYNEVVDSLSKDTTIYLTGHSMGGGIALLLAPMLYAQGYKVKVITFGTPKILYDDMATLDIYSNIQITQYVNRRDVVPAKLFNKPWNYTNIYKKEIGPGGALGIADHDINNYLNLLHTYHEGSGTLY